MKCFTFTTFMLLHAAAFAQPTCPAVKYDWTRPLPGNESGIVVDKQGNFLFNHYHDFQIGVSKLTPDLSPAWTHPSVGQIHANAVAVNAEDNVFIGGAFQESVDFDPGPGVDEKTSRFIYDAFLTKLHPDGSYIWTRTFPDYAALFNVHGIAVDTNGNIVLVGGPGDIALAKLTSDGEHLWYRQIGSTGYDDGLDVAVDVADNIYLFGRFRFTVDFDPGPGVDIHQANDPPGFTKSFVSKFYPDGGYAWTRDYQDDSPIGAMAVSPDGSIVLAGGFAGTVDFDPTDGADFRTSDSSLNPNFGDFYITKLNTDGSYAWTYVLGNGRPEQNDIYVSVDPRNGDIVFAGEIYDRVNLDHTLGELNYACGDVPPTGCSLLVRLSPEGLVRWFDSTPNVRGNSPMTVDSDGTVYYIRSQSYEVDLDQTCAEDWRIPPNSGGYNPILTKYSCRNLTGDIDDDGDVDLLDLAAFQNCFEGSDRDTCASGCDAFDLHPDLALDLLDFSIVSPSVTGPRM
ncbi:MAG: hypothetical protein AABZ47_01140 [Planctomycetota bacterium]